MAGKTTGNMQLEKPSNGEYQNNWDVPLNQNADKIDTHVTALETEVTNSRGSAASLAERLENGLTASGDPKPVPEVEKSRNSQISGRYSDLYDRLNSKDLEFVKGRNLESDLISGLSYYGKDFFLNKAISGPEGAGGTANFLTSAGSVFTVDGAPVPVILNCGGFVQKVRIDAQTDLSGESAGTKYIYAERNASGRVVESSIDQGSISSNLYEFVDSSAQFQTKNVQANDYLVISSGPNAGTYIINSIVDENTITIKGKFVSAIGGIGYEIKDMLHPTISFEATKNQTGSKCYLGEVIFDGVNITLAITYAYKNIYESTWIPINVSSTPTFTQVFNHYLGILPKEVVIYASQQNDEHDPSFEAEKLSLADVATDYDIGHDPGTGDSSVTPTGGPYMTRSVKHKTTRNVLTVRNVRDNVFYKDFNGTMRDSGYIKVILRG